jgi:5'-nucleotidase
MRILVSNDDGIGAAGIQALYTALAKEHEVYMIAPSEEKSACSNAISMRGALSVKRHDERVFSVGGYPADCVNIGLHGKLIPDPDIVISGINHGPNMGEDIYYSGTVAAARVAFINGKTGIAVSLNSKNDLQWLDNAAAFIGHLVTAQGNGLTSSPVLYNINYPAIVENEIRGVTFANLDKRHYVDHYIVSEHSKDSFNMKLEGSLESEYIAGSDADMVRKGYISITPLTLDATDYDKIEKGEKTFVAFRMYEGSVRL